MAYLASNPTMGVKSVARAYDLSEDQVRTYVELVQNRAAEMRDSGPGEPDTNEF
jgi:hypothetical protein